MLNKNIDNIINHTPNSKCYGEDCTRRYENSVIKVRENLGNLRKKIKVIKDKVW
ncbi:hypothetical protein ACQPU1_08440 [Clostridium paraputrificum]|uniref:hypothetical protein n=1 Tax=Clostridium TaxID=1485 RepID=UPI003D337E89